MKKLSAGILLCAGWAIAQSGSSARPAFTPTASAPELHLEGENLTFVKRTLYDYIRSGQYEKEIAQVVAPAHAWIATRAASATPNEKLAAVFDIDETSISGLRNMLDCDFCPPAVQRSIFPEGRLSAIPATQDLYNFAKSKGIKVVFITGRYESDRDFTARQLTQAGYSGWDELILRPVTNNLTAAIFKSDARAALESKGYKIVLNIGDQLSDLSGGHAERTYKLPNPFYYVE